MQIEHCVSPTFENRLDGSIVVRQERIREGEGSLRVGDHVLPAEGEAEAWISDTLGGRREPRCEVPPGGIKKADLQIRSF
jgi:hypothetical protein